MIHGILAALDGSESGRAAGKYAAHLGLVMKARVTALNVVDARALEGPTFRDFTMHMGLEPFETYTQALRDVLEKQAEEIILRFRNDAREMGLPDRNVTAIIETGIIAFVICEDAAKADLVVMGQRSESHTFTGGLLGSTAEQIVRRSPRPVMVCPPNFAPISRPLLAYDGSEPADRALHLAVELAGQLGTGLTVLIVVDGEHMTAARADAIRARALDSVAQSGGVAEVKTVDGYPEQRIVEEGVSEACDLIIMGAFGHSRIRELIVGSTTAYVMRRSVKPVLLVRV